MGKEIKANGPWNLSGQAAFHQSVAKLHRQTGSTKTATHKNQFV